MSSKRQYVHTFPHAWHARGQRFDPAILHFRKARNSMRITGFFVWLKQPRTFQILPGFGTEYDPFCTNPYQTSGLSIFPRVAPMDTANSAGGMRFR